MRCLRFEGAIFARRAAIISPFGLLFRFRLPDLRQRFARRTETGEVGRILNIRVEPHFCDAGAARRIWPGHQVLSSSWPCRQRRGRIRIRAPELVLVDGGREIEQIVQFAPGGPKFAQVVAPGGPPCPFPRLGGPLPPPSWPARHRGTIAVYMASAARALARPVAEEILARLRAELEARLQQRRCGLPLWIDAASYDQARKRGLTFEEWLLASIDEQLG